MNRITLDTYPNNEVRVTFSGLPSPRRRENIYQCDRASLGLPEDRHDPAIRLDEFGDEIIPSSELASENFPPLSLVPNSKALRSSNGFALRSCNSEALRSSTGYGSLPPKPTVFGLNAKRVMVRSGAAMEKSVNDPSECLFLTGTLPGSEDMAFYALAAWSGHVVNRLKAWIAHHVRAKLDFYCWEYQKRGALHLHYCVHIPDAAKRSFIQSGFHAWWVGILHDVGDRENVDLFRKNKHYSHRSDTSKVRAVAEVCRKSPARYLAKYLSKSAVKMKGKARFFSPSRWWGTSRPLKNCLASLSTKTELIIGSYFDCTEKMQEVKEKMECSDGKTYQYKHTYGMGETIICYPSDRSEFDSLFSELKELSRMSIMNAKLKANNVLSELKAYKIRLLNWSSFYADKFEQSKPFWAQSFKSFNLTLMSLAPSGSHDPLSIVYEWSNLLYNMSESFKDTECLRYQSDVKLFDFAASALEDAVKHLCLNGNCWDL